MSRFLVPSLFQELDELQNDLRKASFTSTTELGLSVYEDDLHVFVEAPVPGLKEDEIEITFEKGMLWIRGQKAQESEKENQKFHLKANRQYSYCLKVPGQIDASADIEASYERGLVLVRFKKSEIARPKRIMITQKN